MSRCILFTLSFVCFCILPSLSRLNQGDLAAAVDAFDTFADDVPRSNKAKDKDSSEGTIEKTESPVVELRPSVEEEIIVSEKAYCTGCPYDLDITNGDVIDLAKYALNDIKDGNVYRFVELVKASIEVENGYTYNLKVKANKLLENEPVDVSCFLEVKISHKADSQPNLTYHNCI